MLADPRILDLLKLRVPGLLAVYAFGSRVQGHSDHDSDLDLAVLVEGYANPLLLWQLAHELYDFAGCQVDLLDFRAASTVMQFQILTTGLHWWRKNIEAGLFEAAVLSEKTALDGARALQVADIQRDGHVYAR